MKQFILALLLFISFNSFAINDLTTSLQKKEQQINGRIGVAIIDTKSNQEWSYNGSKHFPMMSSFKTLACANVLYDAQQNKLSLSKKINITKEGLINWNPITQNFVGGQMSLKSICGATMLMSDNYAANLALKEIGGPKSVTEFLRSIGDKETRLDHFEPDLNYVREGEQNDSTTPLAITNTLKKLLTGNILNSKNKDQLLMWMTNNMVSDSLARAVLPEGWEIADRSGGGVDGSRTLTAMVWNKDKKPLLFSIFIANSNLTTLPELNKVVSDISQQIFERYQIVTHIKQPRKNH